jgi:hypothetical protein
MLVERYVRVRIGFNSDGVMFHILQFHASRDWPGFVGNATRLVGSLWSVGAGKDSFG